MDTIDSSDGNLWFMLALMAIADSSHTWVALLTTEQLQCTGYLSMQLSSMDYRHGFDVIKAERISELPSLCFSIGGLIEEAS